MKLLVLELFAGIGACSKALERLGIEHEIVDAVEIDKFAIKSFNAIHGTNFEAQDISKWNKDIKVDLIMHGSPCQDFSIAGKGAGGDKGTGTRSSLMYETLRIVDKVKPKYVIWENVKNLLSNKHRHNFEAYLQTMEELGYVNYYQVLNAKDYGIPQNRERIFMISVYLPDEPKFGDDLQSLGIFKFPNPIKLKTSLKDILDKEVDKKFYLSPSVYANVEVKEITDKTRKNHPVRIGGLYDKNGDKFKHHQAGSIYDTSGIAPTLSTMQGGNQEPIIRCNDGIRKLTPKECWKLMGFSEDDFEKAAKVNSNSQLYKQACNSIVVNVLEAILKNLLVENSHFTSVKNQAPGIILALNFTVFFC